MDSGSDGLWRIEIKTCWFCFIWVELNSASCVFEWESWRQKDAKDIHPDGHDDILAILPLLIKIWTPKIYLQHILHCNFFVFFQMSKCFMGKRRPYHLEIWRWLWLGGGETSIPAWVVEIAGRTFKGFLKFTSLHHLHPCENDWVVGWKSLKTQNYGILKGRGGVCLGFLFLTFFGIVPQEPSWTPFSPLGSLLSNGKPYISQPLGFSFSAVFWGHWWAVPPWTSTASLPHGTLTCCFVGLRQVVHEFNSSIISPRLPKTFLGFGVLGRFFGVQIPPSPRCLEAYGFL